MALPRLINSHQFISYTLRMERVATLSSALITRLFKLHEMATLIFEQASVRKLRAAESLRC